MRSPRLKLGEESAVYHCITRTVNGEFLLGDQEKEMFRRQMHKAARFSGVEILTFCIMNNHVHLLVRVPNATFPSDDELIRRIEVLYGKNSKQMSWVNDDVVRNNEISSRLRVCFGSRMGDISEFMKTLKQRFTIWFNKSHDRFGTLWAERFKSLIVEDYSDSLSAVAAYIDLNPVRAGIVKDPKDYRFSGYGEAISGKKIARAGLQKCHSRKGWKNCLRDYRKLMYVTGACAGNRNKTSIPEEHVLQVLKDDGELTLNQMLRLRIRYFTDGSILGSKLFVEEKLRTFRNRLGTRRKKGACPLGAISDRELYIIRKLRADSIG